MTNILKDPKTLKIEEIYCTELKGENMEKIFIITDIARLYKLYLTRSLSVDEFDILYDLSVRKLERTFANTRDQLERDTAYKKLQWH